MRRWFPHTFADLPLLMQLGLLLVACGGALDVLYHAGWAPQISAHLGHGGGLAHLATFVGMVVALLGVLMRRNP